MADKQKFIPFRKLLGMDVYTEEGEWMGNVEDVTFNQSDGSLSKYIIVRTEKKSGGFIPVLSGAEGEEMLTVNAEDVKAIGDIVIVRSRPRAEREEREESEEEEVIPGA